MKANTEWSFSLGNIFSSDSVAVGFTKITQIRRTKKNNLVFRIKAHEQLDVGHVWRNCAKSILLRVIIIIHFIL